MSDYFSSFSSWVGSRTKNNSSSSDGDNHERDHKVDNVDYRVLDQKMEARSTALRIDRVRRSAAAVEIRKSPAEASLRRYSPALAEVEHQDTIWSEGGQGTISDSDNTVKSGEARERRGHYVVDKEDRVRDHDRIKRQPILPYPMNSEVDLRSKCRMLEQKKEDAERRANVLKKTCDETEEDVRKLEMELERTTRLLETANHRASEMHAHINRQSEELLVYKGELRRAEGQHEATKKLLDEKTVELNGAQAFLNQADTLSGADVISMVNSLNAKVMQAAAFMADTLEFGHISSKEDSWQKAANEVKWMLPDNLIRAVHTLCRRKGAGDDFDSTLIQFALQICLTSCCYAVTTFWGFNDKDDWIKKIYSRIQKRENQVVTRRWRMMTRAHLGEVKDANIWIRFMSDNLSKVLTIMGCPQVGNQTAFAKFAERLSVITELALRLQSAVGEGVTSADIEPYVVRHDVLFQEESMEDMYDSTRRPSNESIVGTTELGLRKTVDGVNYTVMAKAKVFLRSSLLE